MGMLPNKEFRASVIPPIFTSSVHLAWNLIMVWQRRPGAAKCLLDAATVKPIWRTNSTYRLESPQCELIQDS
ncbi:hypothetical protein FA13DRAFT_1735217 [Coprinellus micaceus]|uniref:Uncharacterized protein n=1 Tax=Coprinellus micaceus TaxID=71717 RepID=A0A4Y7T4P9_COPMI|nr:hypothetical protein FA13DRAFT_1735217 [Coprinellus micaceus]